MGTRMPHPPAQPNRALELASYFGTHWAKWEMEATEEWAAKLGPKEEWGHHSLTPAEPQLLKTNQLLMKDSP